MNDSSIMFHSYSIILIQHGIKIHSLAQAKKNVNCFGYFMTYDSRKHDRSEFECLENCCRLSLSV